MCIRDRYNGSQWTGFVFGVLFICIGVYGLAPQDIDIIANVGRRNSLRIDGPAISSLIENESIRTSISRKSIVNINNTNPMLASTFSISTNFPFSNNKNNDNYNDDNDDYHVKNTNDNKNKIDIEMNSFPFATGKVNNYNNNNDCLLYTSDAADE